MRVGMPERDYNTVMQRRVWGGDMARATLTQQNTSKTRRFREQRTSVPSRFFQQAFSVVNVCLPRDSFMFTLQFGMLYGL